MEPLAVPAVVDVAEPQGLAVPLVIMVHLVVVELLVRLAPRVHLEPTELQEVQARLEQMEHLVVREPRAYQEPRVRLAQVLSVVELRTEWQSSPVQLHSPHQQTYDGIVRTVDWVLAVLHHIRFT